MNTTTHAAIAAAQHQMEAPIVGRLTGEEVATAAYAQFGIVADDAEIVAFAAWVLEQAGHGKLADAAKATTAAWDSMFSQCAGNPITNAWGKEVSVLKLNEANYAAEKALQAAGFVKLLDLADVWDQAAPVTTHAPGAA